MLVDFDHASYVRFSIKIDISQSAVLLSLLQDRLRKESFVDPKPNIFFCCPNQLDGFFMKNIVTARPSVVGLIVLVSSCYYSEDIPRPGTQAQCEGSGLALTSASQNASGCGKADGSISVSPSGGISPYAFSLNGGPRVSSGTFSNLMGGTYVVAVFDAKSCQAVNEIEVETIGSAFAAAVSTIVPDSDCFGANGSVELTATGGKTPYQYALGSGFGTSAVFNNLAAGTYNAVVRDADLCEISLGVVIPNESSTRYNLDIKPILEAKCNFQSCHGPGTGRRDYTTFDTVKAAAAEIKIRTANGTMPKKPAPGGSLSAEQIKQIACWVDEGALNN
jgi:hypothetical protein